MTVKGKQNNKKQKKSAPVQQDTLAKPETTVTRRALMLKAKEKGIKNFRVLNKEELGLVLAEGITPEQIQKIVSEAVARWKSGWGSRKNKQKK